MNKLQLVLFGVLLVIAIVITQKSGLLKNFPKNTKQLSKQPSVPVSINTNEPILGIQFTVSDKQNVKGAYITQVVTGSPAERAKLQEKDIITKIDSYLLEGLQKQDVYKLILNFKVGQTVNFKVWRNNEFKNINIVIE